MDERQRIEQAIEAQESLRGIVSDEVIDETISMLREKLAHQETPEQQRKLVTILYIDIVGSTNIVKHLDPEDALEIMDGSLKRMAVPVEENGGHVVRFMGDGFKAVFGMPKAHENDPEMAIRAGLGVQEIAQQLGGELKTQWSILDFQVRVGINTGLVALGGMTEAEDTVMGSAVNLAKRVESAAPPGELLISHDTYRHVRGVFDVEPREPIIAKGFDEPVQVYLIFGIKPRVFRVRTHGVEGIETRMVGREIELITLQNAFRDAMDGHTQVVTIVGEAGVGKSRLLYEFQNWFDLLPDEVRFFQGRGMQEAQQLPYALLKDVFTFGFQIQESDRSSEVQKKIEDGFGEVVGVDDKGQMCSHIIGQLLGFDFSESNHVKGIMDDPQQLHDRALMYLGEYFQGMSERVPVIVFLEDIHWGDDSSLDMLNHLLRRNPEQRLLGIYLTRHRLFDRYPEWGDWLINHNQIILDPLSLQDSRKLVVEILKHAEQVPKTFLELVVSNAEGNPFYVEELIKMLIEDGIIVIGERRWRIEPERLVEIKVPPTLTSVLQARLDSLPPIERETLQQASVVGRIFWDNTVEYITNESSSYDTQSALHITDENLSSLRSRELIYHSEESAFIDAGEYNFKHVVLRDVTYESVLKRVRRAYHGVVAEWLIQHSGERAGEYTGLIADHLELAGKNEQALIYLYQTGEQASKRYANKEALEYFTRALTLTPQDDLVGRFNLLLAREKVLDSQGNRESQQMDLTTLKEISIALGDVDNQAVVALRQAAYAEVVGEYQEIVQSSEKAIELAHGAQDIPNEARGYLFWGRALWRQGDWEMAGMQLHTALDLARQASLRQEEAECLRNLGIVSARTGDYAQADIQLNEALEIFREIGDRQGQTGTINAMGVFAAELGDFDSARERFEQSLSVYREIGDRWGEGAALSNLGQVCAERGSYKDARKYLEQALEICAQIDDREGEGTILNNLGQMVSEQGDYGAARDYLSKAVQIHQEIGNPRVEGFALGNLGLVYLHMGDLDSTVEYIDQGLQVLRVIDDPQGLSMVLAYRALCHHRLGQNETARDVSREAFRIAEDVGDRAAQAYALMTLGHALTVLDDPAGAAEAYQQSLEIRLELDQQNLAAEAHAGLADLALAAGDSEKAKTHVEFILDYLESGNLDGAFEPLRVYLTCIQVLRALEDARADAVLDIANFKLHQQAYQIDDPALKSSYLSSEYARGIQEFQNSGE